MGHRIRFLRRCILACWLHGVLLLASTGAAPALAAPQSAPALIMPRAAGSLLVDIARAGDRLVAVGERGHVLYSDDSGKSWTQARVPVSVLLTAVWFSDAGKGWAVGHDGMILASADGGSSWRLQRDGLAAQAAANRASLEDATRAADALESRAAGDAALADELAEARLALEEAQELSREPLFAPPLMDVWFADENHGFAVGAYGVYLRTADGGQTWTDARADIDNPDDMHYYAIASGGEGRLLIAGESGTMFRSLDGGDSWEALPPAYAGTLFGALAVPGTSTVCVFGLQGNVLVSADFGASWQPLKTAAEVVLAGATLTAAGEALIVGSMGTVLRADLGSGAVRQRDVAGLRDNLAAVVEAPDGSLVVAGQSGVRRIEDAGRAADARISAVSR